MMFLDCPAYLDENGAARCGLPAEVRCRFTMSSTDGPLECAMIRCPVGHWFNGAIASLTWQGSQKHDPGHAASRAGRDSLAGSHDGPDGSGGFIRDFPGEPGRAISRPNSAPAYYLGRPARLWITVLSPRSRRTVSAHVLDAVPGGWGHTPSQHNGLPADAGIETACVTRQAKIGASHPASCARSEHHAGHLGVAGAPLAGPCAASTRPGPEGGTR